MIDMVKYNYSMIDAILLILQKGGKTMTLISFFDPDPLDNIGDILFFQPRKCIFVGESHMIGGTEREKIDRFLRNRGMDTVVEYRTISYGDLEGATDILARIVMEYPDCVFDVSGGTEMLLSLAGRIREMFDIPIYQRRGQSQELLWQLDCNLDPGKVTLTIEEVVALHSGKVLEALSPPKSHEQLYKDIPKLWEIARMDPEAYNRTCQCMAYLIKHNESTAPHKLRISKQIQSRAPGRIDRKILEKLEEAGLICDVQSTDSGLQLTFCSDDLPELLKKAGNLLELVTCMAGSFADDSAMGISMDWDGVVESYGISGTRNELDVMLTVGLIPVCISCKNGVIDNKALYELDTVSRHFAGNFAKRILVATYVTQNAQSAQFLAQRAKDMGIIPMFDAHLYSFEEFKNKLRELCDVC